MDLQWDKRPRQGAVGDCWLISVLEALYVSDRQRLQGMVKDLGGGWVEVRLPGKMVWLRTVFNIGAATPLWATIVEKACAIVLGGYKNLHGGRISVAAELLGAKVLRLHCPTVCTIRTPGGGFHAAMSDQTWVLVPP
jgi:hypothetical protein